MKNYRPRHLKKRDRKKNEPFNAKKNRFGFCIMDFFTFAVLNTGMERATETAAMTKEAAMERAALKWGRSGCMMQRKRSRAEKKEDQSGGNSHLF